MPVSNVASRMLGTVPGKDLLNGGEHFAAAIYVHIAGHSTASNTMPRLKELGT